MTERINWDALEDFATETGLEFPWATYEYIPQVMRDQDPFGIFKALFQGIQAEMELYHTKLHRTTQLQDPRLCIPEVLKHLKANVGFSPDLDYLTANLDDVGLRKLIALAVAMWKEKGTKDGIINMIRAFTGRPALMKDWFDYRWLVGVGGQLWNGTYTVAPWIIGGQYGVMAEYLSSIRIERDPTTPEDREVIRGLLDLIRPVQENFEVAYPDFLELFESVDRWTTLAGLIEAIEADPPYMRMTGPALVLSQWAPATPLFQINTHLKTAAAVGSAAAFNYMLMAADPLNGYILQLVQSPTNTVTLYRRVAGVDVPLGSAVIPNLLDPQYFYGVQVTATQTAIAQTRLRVAIDGHLKLDVIDATYNSGDLYLEAVTPDRFMAEFLEAFDLPLLVEYIEA